MIDSRVRLNPLPLAVLLVVSGCAVLESPPGSRQPAGVPASAPVEPRSTSAPVATQPEPAQTSGSSSVVALAEQSETDARAGQYDRAAAALERALRLEPRNAWLWHRLALVRRDQGQFAQAIQLASKSNSLAGERRALQADNWDVIGSAWELAGDRGKAGEAYERAARLRQGG